MTHPIHPGEFKSIHMGSVRTLLYVQINRINSDLKAIWIETIFDMHFCHSFYFSFRSKDAVMQCICLDEGFPSLFLWCILKTNTDLLWQTVSLFWEQNNWLNWLHNRLDNKSIRRCCSPFLHYQIWRFLSALNGNIQTERMHFGIELACQIKDDSFSFWNKSAFAIQSFSLAC